MSGGVDSSVIAALLKEEGHDITGAYMKQWSDSKEVSGVCSWKEDRRDALRVTAKLHIPMLTLDFEKEYKEWVMKYMFDEYEKGKTPNPDVMCNKYIKFGFWLKKAEEMGFDAIATGHYCSVEERDGKYHLMMAKDQNKDQCYFLHQLNQEQLSKAIFPLGKYDKSEVRALAEKFELPTAKRAESMGICFVGEVPMQDFLSQKIKPKKGKIVFSSSTPSTSSGASLQSGSGDSLQADSEHNKIVLGEHDGLPFYTIGQRNVGIESSAVSQKKGENKPLFVVAKREESNELVLGFDDDPLLFSEKRYLDEMHFTLGESPELPFDCTVRLRHRQALQEATIDKDEKGYFVQFKEAQRAVTPGQFCVVYKNGECFGGGSVV